MLYDLRKIKISVDALIIQKPKMSVEDSPKMDLNHHLSVKSRMHSPGWKKLDTDRKLKVLSGYSNYWFTFVSS